MPDPPSDRGPRPPKGPSSDGGDFPPQTIRTGLDPLVVTQNDHAIELRAKSSLLVKTPVPSEGRTRKRSTPGRQAVVPTSWRARSSKYAGRYEPVGLIGVGGMGSVYRVRDQMLNEEVALKIMRKDLGDSSASIARFRREVKLARRINHPNVVRVFEVGECEGEHFYTMECVSGDGLSTLLAQGEPLEIGRAVSIAIQIAAGLSSVHEAKIVHRDLKPDNVLVGRDGRVVISDFGVAVLHDEVLSGQLPMHGAGTPMYMAPEQIEGRSIDEKTDLYALGLIVFEMLTGTLPWGREPDLERTMGRLSVPAPTVRSRNPRVPESVSNIVSMLLERDPAGRPRDAVTVLRVLEMARDQLRDAPPAALPETLSEPPVGLSRSLPPAIATTDMPHSRSVAVLPVCNIGSPNDDYIAEALTTKLVERLILCPHVRVASRATLQLEQGGDLREIGARAGVDVVVDGTARKRSTGALRIRIRVIEMQRGFVLWSEKFERPASELFSLQDEIADAVARTLSIEVRRDRPDRRPENGMNVDSFLRAKRLYGDWTPTGAAEALTLLNEAVRVSPSDPLLVSYRALAQLRLWQLDPHAPANLASDAQGSVRTILETAPNLAEAHLALGVHALLNANWVVAARRLEEATRCNPALSEAHQFLGVLHCHTGHVEQGMRMLDVALRLDPRNMAAMWEAAIAHGLAGKAERADQYLSWADFVFENHPTTLSTRLRVAVWNSNRAELASAHRIASGSDLLPGNIESNIVRLFTDADPDREVGALTAAAASPEAAPAVRGRIMKLVAERTAMLGQLDEAWSALRAAAPNSIDALWFGRCPALARLTRMPAFSTLRSQVVHRAGQVFDASVSAKPGSGSPGA